MAEQSERCTGFLGLKHLKALEMVLRCANQVISPTNSRDLSKFTALRRLDMHRERQLKSWKSCFIVSGTGAVVVLSEIEIVRGLYMATLD